MTDKTRHFLLCAFIGVAAAFTARYAAGLLLGLSVLCAVVCCALAALGKETYDICKPNPTGFDLGDLMADAAGMVAGVSLFILIDILAE